MDKPSEKNTMALRPGSPRMLDTTAINALAVEYPLLITLEAIERLQHLLLHLLELRIAGRSGHGIGGRAGSGAATRGGCFRTAHRLPGLARASCASIRCSRVDPNCDVERLPNCQPLCALCRRHA